MSTSDGSTAANILTAALGHMRDRAATYDKPEGERSMGATVDAFHAVTGVSMTEEQGWLFMALLKAVRSQQGAYRADSYEDGAAYFALAGGAAVRDRLPKTEQQEHTDTLAQFDERRDALRCGSGGGSHTVVLPDGSAFGVVSIPISKDHWLYADRAYEDGADQPKELPAPILSHGSRETVVAAARYAVRGATNCGKEPDFDPDALVQNVVYALCGPYGRVEPIPVDPADVEIASAIDDDSERMQAIGQNGNDGEHYGAPDWSKAPDNAVAYLDWTGSAARFASAFYSDGGDRFYRLDDGIPMRQYVLKLDDGRMDIDYPYFMPPR